MDEEFYKNRACPRLPHLDWREGRNLHTNTLLAPVPARGLQRLPLLGLASPPPRDPLTGWVPRSVEPPLLARCAGWLGARIRHIV
jgi:hypothetical protein